MIAYDVESDLTNQVQHLVRHKGIWALDPAGFLSRGFLLDFFCKENGPCVPVDFIAACSYSDEAPTNKICRRASSDVHARDLVTHQNVLIRDKISFVGVAHLTHGGRSCSWALYRGRFIAATAVSITIKGAASESPDRITT